jgi:hypothetical protein
MSVRSQGILYVLQGTFLNEIDGMDGAHAYLQIIGIGYSQLPCQLL